MIEKNKVPRLAANGDGGMPNNSVSTMAGAIVREFADVISRRVPLEDFALKFDVDVEQAHRMKAEVVNAVLMYRVRNFGDEQIAHVPTTGLGLFAHSSIHIAEDSCYVELHISVSNELEVELAEVGLDCISFTNASMTTLTFDGPLELIGGSERSLLPGGVLSYRARYMLSDQDFSDDGPLICSFIAQGYSKAGEWAIGQEDALIELPEQSAVAKDFATGNPDHPFLLRAVP